MANEEKLEVDGQWFYRGNLSPAWFATFREGGGQAERVPREVWPLLEEIVALRHDISKAVANHAADLRPEDAKRVAEVRLNDDGTLDEVVTKQGDQLEQMDFNHWFLQIGDVAVWLHSRGKIVATHERRPYEIERLPQEQS